MGQNFHHGMIFDIHLIRGHSITTFAMKEGGGVSEKANKGKQGDGRVVRSKRLHFKRFQRRILAAIT